LVRWLSCTARKAGDAQRACRFVPTSEGMMTDGIYESLPCAVSARDE
jgi:hypothetical protein